MTRREKRRRIGRALKIGCAVLQGAAGLPLLSRKNRRRAAGLISRESMGKLVIFGAFGALMYFKGRLLPKYADDYPYSFKWDPRYGNLTQADRSYERVKTVKDLVRSQIAHYHNWDGRVLADFLVQLSLMKDDKKTFDILNTMVILAQLLVCAGMGKGRIAGLKSLSVREVFLLAAGFWVCTPHLVATCFWLTGSITYLWTGLMETLYVLAYTMHYHDPGISIPPPLAAAMGLAAGWSMETGAGAALMVSGMELIRSLYRKEAAAWMTAGVLGACVGIALLLAAPGNRVKFRLEREMSNTLPLSMEDRVPGYVPPEYIYTPTMFKLWFLEGFLPTVFRELPLQLPVLLYFLRGKERNAESTGFILAMEAAVLAIPTVMMLSPEYPARSTYHSVLYLFPAALKALEHLDIPPVSGWSTAGKLAGGLSAIALTGNILATLIVDADLCCQHREQVEAVLQNREEEVVHVANVGLPEFYSRLAGNRSIAWDTVMGLCLEDKTDPYNRAAAAYYGAKSIECGPWEDHRYYSKKPEDVLYRLVNPLKSLSRVIRGFLRGDQWPLSAEAVHETEESEP